MQLICIYIESIAENTEKKTERTLVGSTEEAEEVLIKTWEKLVKDGGHMITATIAP